LNYTRKASWILAIAILAGIVLTTIGYVNRQSVSTELIPVIVVEKIVHPANVSYLPTMFTGGDGKAATPKRIFKSQIREAEYILVGCDQNGIEYNIRTDRISWTTIKPLDTLWTTK
jgi:hypothetical protein